MENSITKEIEIMIGVLNKELSRLELEDGWSEERKTKWLTYFDELLRNIKKQKTIPPTFIAKWMDCDGICKGDLFEKGANISYMLREHSNINVKNA